jgi:hypothetical protein
MRGGLQGEQKLPAIADLPAGSIVDFPDDNYIRVFYKVRDNLWLVAGSTIQYSDQEVAATPGTGWIRYRAEPVGFVNWQIHLECPGDDVYSSFVEWDSIDEENLPLVVAGKIYPRYRLGDGSFFADHQHAIQLSPQQILDLAMVRGRSLEPTGFPVGFFLTQAQAEYAEQLRKATP